MQKWSLPTISEVLSLNELTLKDCCNPNMEWTAATENNRGEFVSLPVNSTEQKTTTRLKAEREWCGAITALQQILLQTIDLNTLDRVEDDQLPSTQGLVFAGATPVLSDKALLSNLSTWLFTAESLNFLAGTKFQPLPPQAGRADDLQNLSSTVEFTANAGSERLPCAMTGLRPMPSSILPLLAGDPLSSEQFCLVLTAKFSLVMVLGEDANGLPAFQFSFEPEVVEQTWRFLRARVVLSDRHSLVKQLDTLVEQYYPAAPDYRTVTQFSRLLLKHLPQAEEAKSNRQTDVAPHLPLTSKEKSEFSISPLAPEKRASSPSPHLPLVPRGKREPNPSPRPDVELLQAFAHEVRTPLTTIRTLTRLLLKRRDLAIEAIERLKIIDRECTEQIDRMELLFRAAELETSTLKHTNAHLTAMSLTQVLQQSIPRWQQSASRRNLTLDVVLPQQLPTVVSDPTMLVQVLTGLIENFTRSLPAGSHIQVQVIPAGDQLKLQLLTQSQLGESGKTAERSSAPPACKSLGQLLMFQPETGTISLNLAATKHLFQAIGGKLIVRQRPHQGEVLTIFLPLEVSHTEFCG